ncbi:hypothetical protein BC830DRAFT_343320 [Chytriomyces sp. MP71]|nr:hypothetical protein BC830DRAFT_343320 [Chytriomyces sp. MP71]
MMRRKWRVEDVTEDVIIAEEAAILVKREARLAKEPAVRMSISLTKKAGGARPRQRHGWGSKDPRRPFGFQPCGATCGALEGDVWDLHRALDLVHGHQAEGDLMAMRTCLRCIFQEAEYRNSIVSCTIVRNLFIWFRLVWWARGIVWQAPCPAPPVAYRA